MTNQNKPSKLNFQRSTVTWKLFCDLFIDVVMTAYASRIAEHGRVAISNNYTLDSGFTQYTSTYFAIYQIINMNAQTKSEIISGITATAVKKIKQTLKRALTTEDFVEE